MGGWGEVVQHHILPHNFTLTVVLKTTKSSITRPFLTVLTLVKSQDGLVYYALFISVTVYIKPVPNLNMPANQKY